MINIIYYIVFNIQIILKMAITQAIIMAGGEGKRMNSNIPKVLHKVRGEEMIVKIIKVVISQNINTIYVVCGSKIQEIKDCINKQNFNINIIFVYQPIARGTGDAIKCCLPYINDPNINILILNGDTPLIDLSLSDFLTNNTPSLLVTKLDNPYGNGRIITDASGKFIKIVEEKDANQNEKKIRLVNCGVYFISSADLLKYIPQLSCNNAQNEYYLTDICEHLQNNLTLVELPKYLQYELLNVNSPKDLMKAERYCIEHTLLFTHKLLIRTLEYNDFDKGYINLVKELSNTISIDNEMNVFQKIYDSVSKNEYHNIFVIEDILEKRIVGSVTLLVEPKFIHNGSNVGHIEDVVISATHRSKKIGKTMIEYVNTFIHEFECYKIILDCVDGLEKFYASCGYEKKNIQMSLYV